MVAECNIRLKITASSNILCLRINTVNPVACKT